MNQALVHENERSDSAGNPPRLAACGPGKAALAGRLSASRYPAKMVASESFLDHFGTEAVDLGRNDV